MYARLTIDTGALARNAATLARLIAPAAPAFVVKSNAYGHGIVEVARAVEAQSSGICVYSASEAFVLRGAGVHKKLIVLGPIEPADLDELVARDIEFALWDSKAFSRDAAAAAQRRQRDARAHIKINTGLNRLGIEAEDLSDAVEDTLRLPGVVLAGIFSHLASAEEIDSPYTTYQLDRYERAINASAPALAAANVNPTRHIAASAAAMLWPKTRLDMARMGIALYGLWPSAQTKEAMNGNAIDLEPVLRYESELVVVRSIAAGAAIGYGCSYHAPRSMRIGVLPVGYADGTPRALSNRGAFLVDGMRVPIVGRIAMNMCVVDLGPAPNAHVGSRVTLIGNDGGAAVSADDWAAWADTINYEVVTRLPQHLQRTYLT